MALNESIGRIGSLKTGTLALLLAGDEVSEAADSHVALASKVAADRIDVNLGGAASIVIDLHIAPDVVVDDRSGCL